MSKFFEKERFVYYVSIGDMPSSRAVQYVTNVRDSFLQTLRDENHGEMPEGEKWYFIAVRGDSKIERL